MAAGDGGHTVGVLALASGCHCQGQLAGGHTLGVAAGDGGHTVGVLALASGGHCQGQLAGSGSHSLGLLTGAVVAGPSSLCRPQALL